jgi:deoxyribonuclease-4
MQHPIKLGAHVSIAGTLSNAPERARQMGCEGFQIFNTNPRNWRQTKVSDFEKEQFRARTKKLGVGPAFIHTIYLINLASSTPQFWELSIQALVDALLLGREIGARAVVTHVGSPKDEGFKVGLERVHEALRRLCATLDRYEPDSVRLCLEFSAGTGSHIGKTFEELTTILDPFEKYNFGVTLDTAHMFTSGVELRTQAALEELVVTIEKTIGFERVEFIHLNDSKAPFGSGADRHEDIGKGEIGLDALTRFVHHPRFRDFNFILETPALKTAPPDTAWLDTIRTQLGIK